MTGGERMSQPRWLDMHISLGHIIQAIVLCFGLGAGYAGLSAKTDALKQDLENQKAVLVQARAELQRSDVAAAHEATLTQVLEDLRQRLDRIEAKIDIIK